MYANTRANSEAGGGDPTKGARHRTESNMINLPALCTVHRPRPKLVHVETISISIVKITIAPKNYTYFSFFFITVLQFHNLIPINNNNLLPIICFSTSIVE